MLRSSSKQYKECEIKQHKGLYHETKFLLACIFHKIRHNGYCKGRSC